MPMLNHFEKSKSESYIDLIRYCNNSKQSRLQS